MSSPPKLSINPPLLNAACAWATDEDDLRALLLCPSTGAVTTRTGLIGGFDHRADQHRYLFFDPATVRPYPGTSSGPPEPPPPPPRPATTSTSSVLSPATTSTSADPSVASFNTLGYSPLTLHQYLSILSSLATSLPPSTHSKTIIISVTGSPQDIAQSYSTILSASSFLPFPLAMEINLSCPNIKSSPPPAYSASSLTTYLDALPSNPTIPIGIKVPPYIYSAQFDTLASALRGTDSQAPIPASKLSFVTSTNTLGSCLLLDSTPSSFDVSLPGDLGGMAGPPLHPLSLGNVSTLRKLFDADPSLSHLDIIGVGGVSDVDGYKRMRHVGASAVGVATALGRQGVTVFESIESGLNSSWSPPVQEIAKL